MSKRSPSYRVMTVVSLTMAGCNSAISSACYRKQLSHPKLITDYSVPFPWYQMPTATGPENFSQFLASIKHQAVSVFTFQNYNQQI
jgi:hypothetical protein